MTRRPEHVERCDQALATLLADVSAQMATGPDALEAVSVRVLRSARFSHTATTPRGLTLDIDEPVGFGGTGQAPDPAEYLLAALGASLSVTLTAHAAMRGLAIDHVEIATCAHIHAPSFFNPRSGKRPGLLDIDVVVILTSPMTKAQARGVLAEAVRASPVLRSLKRRPKVNLQLQRVP
jgi:pyruvate dehydrogenase E2 component (dihydrolipoamide acetyltransferase)